MRAAGAPLLLIAAPSAALGALFCIAKPAAATAFVIFLSGFIGSIIAFTGLPAESLARSLLVCLWLAVIFLHATGRGAPGKLWIWPGVAIPALYVLLTAAQIPIAENVSAAFNGFTVSAWYMFAFLLLAIAPWSGATIKRVVHGVVLITLAVGVYAVFRKIVGPSTDETILARASTGVRASEPIRFFGSFLGPQQLAAWGSAAIPFLLAISLGWRGKWRLAAIGGVALCTFAVIASDIRTGIVAAAAGAAFVLLLLQVARSFKGPRLAIGLVALLCVGGLGTIGYTLTLSESDSSSTRFERILTPGDDYAYQQRTARWEQAIDDINDQPFGHGLGTAGLVGQTENPNNFAGPLNVDSSYLKVGLEQGYPGLILFGVALLALLAGLTRRAIATENRWHAALGLAAAGTLISQIILFYGSTYIEGITALFAWLLIGLGAAPFTFVPEEEPPEKPAAGAARSRGT